MTLPVQELLRTAVAALGGVERSGQVEMATAVADAIDTGEHLLVQAGTGTGKSLAYLVPAIEHGRRVVVATATLALQAQLAGRDLPLLTTAVAPTLGRTPRFAILKGRANYACLHRLDTGVPDDQGMLVEVAPSSPVGREVVRVREWLEDSETGDRDDLVPGVSDRAWTQVSVSARECLGAERCPFGTECFAERARGLARQSDIVVTNHALLAIDALHGRTVLPEHEVVVVDEAHELVARVTGAATAELTSGMVERASRWSRQLAGEESSAALEDAGEGLRVALAVAPVGRLDRLPAELGAALALVRDAARAVTSALTASDKGDAATSAAAAQSGADAMERQVKALVNQVYDVAERLVANLSSDVAWLEDRARGGLVLRVAPLSVAGLLRDRLFADRTVILTSATLALGGQFEAVARSVGLAPLPMAGVEVDGSTAAAAVSTAAMQAEDQPIALAGAASTADKTRPRDDATRWASSFRRAVSPPPGSADAAAAGVARSAAPEAAHADQAAAGVARSAAPESADTDLAAAGVATSAAAESADADLAARGTARGAGTTDDLGTRRAASDGSGSGSTAPAGADAAGERPTAGGTAWRGLDVGSPFDYGKQGILYIARHLPPPGRDGPGDAPLGELLDLVTAAGGRTLGLFSSRRAAEAAAAYVRLKTDLPVLCQGDDGLAELGRQFRDDPRASLFGTLSLWQGIDVPGATCQLVVIDRIPFPRPDDPLFSARARAVDEAGGNGFMTVAAAHAALLLAQGSGRLIRTAADRGVVAVLDPRLATARYRDFLLRSMPAMWRTNDRETVLAALRRLDAAQPT